MDFTLVNGVRLLVCVGDQWFSGKDEPVRRVLIKWETLCFGRSDMTTVVAVCAGFRGWRLSPAEVCPVTCEDGRCSAEKRVQAVGVNDGVRSASFSSTGKLEVDAGSANFCSDLMGDLIPVDTGSGKMVEDFSVKHDIRTVLKNYKK